jgi:hypothetical protein
MARWPAFRDYCLADGIAPGSWFTEGANLMFTPGDAAFTITEMESEEDRKGALYSMSQGLPPIPKALVTNFSPFAPLGLYRLDLAKPFVDAGFTCLTECYLPECVNCTPANQDFIARERLGFKKVQPVFGTYGGKTLADYPTTDPYFRGWSVYLAEYIF